MPKTDLPIIIESATSSFSPKNLPHDFNGKAIKSFVPTFFKIILILLVIVIIFEVITGIKTVKKSQPRVETITPMSGGSIVLLPNQKQVLLNKNVTVKVRLDTGGHTINGSDIIVHYDPKYLKITKNDIKTGGVFAEFPLSEVDETNGVIRISGVASLNAKGFSGINNLATLNFQTLSPGTTKLTVDYQAGSTTDSNMIESSTAQDITSQITDASITITNK